MSESGDMRAAYLAKSAEELAAANRLLPGSDRVACVGAPGARVMLVKGLAGPAEESGDAALSGPDGEAIARALEALGFDPNDAFATLSRVESGVSSERVVTRLQMQIEAVDPVHIVALDDAAAADVAAACALERLVPGRAVRAAGRSVVAVQGFESALFDTANKKKVWAQLKALAPEPPVW